MEKEGSMMELESIPNDTENRQEEWYQQLSLDNVKAFIRSNIAAASRSFIAIGYYLKYARDKKLYEEDGHASIWEFAREEYGISKSTASRYMTMNDRFSEGGNSPIVAKAYRGYGKSQLQEMLYLNDEQLEQVTPDTQVKQIREIRQPVREVPYFELPGQLSIDDFPDVMPEPVEYQVQPAANTGSTVLSVKDFEADEQGIAISQQEKWNEVALEEAEVLREKPEPDSKTIAPASEETVVDTNTCPPNNNSSCRRQEWGTSPEEQKAGHKECVKCWEDWKNRQKVLNAAKVQREEIPLPNENWNLGDLPQVKEKYLKQLAEKLVEKMGNRLIREEISGIPSDKSIKKSVQTLDEQEGDGIGLEDCVKAFACAEIVEFSREDEDLGICSYNRLANQVRKTLEGWEAQNETVIDAKYTEVEEPEAVQSEEESLTDLQIAREELERAQRLLDKCLLDLPDESNINIRRLKTKVDALACYVCELDDIENPPPKPVQPELPLLKNNDQRAAFVDDYETWPLWIETKETGERYYRYDLEDGTSMVVKVYHAKLFDYKTEGLIYEERFAEGYGRHEYYLLEPGKFFRNCATNRSNLIEKLKEIQKKETGIGNSCDFVGANKMKI
ncbi:hypothetical protein HMPREF9474_03494 [ [[Clostridium] symbiosum WAL-14163]|uniref:Uncharacterized protein n=1 Tax=Clostridium symbiosum (strain WAL-14163) TaxID=742740 RepID=E7GRE9_CLOS6|nr:hypothetical protein [[Clostridium] symbiosum]EGA92605.1 hypothetical protein HMPREF9474_03494 [ [[Clostridium] symbiosum WAL-14163]